MNTLISQSGGRTGRDAWLAVASIASSTFLLVTSEFLPIGLLGSIARSLGITDGYAGLAVTVPGATAAVAAPLLTILARRIDRRQVLLSLSVLVLVSNLIVATSANVGWFLAGRVLLGIGVGGFWTFSLAAGRNIVAAHHGARASAVISAGIGLGTVVGVPVGTLLGGWLGWRAAFVVAAGCGLIVLVAQLLLVPRLPVTNPAAPSALLKVFRNAQARVGLYASFLTFAAEFAGYTYLEPFLRDVVHSTSSMVTTALLIYGAMGVVATFAAEKAIGASLRWTFIAAALLMALSMVGAVPLAQTPWAAYCMVGIWGLAFGAIPISLQIWMFQASPDDYEGSSAIVVTTSQTAIAVGSFLGGRTADVGGPSTSFIVGAAFALVAAICMFAWGRLRHDAPAPVNA